MKLKRFVGLGLSLVIMLTSMNFTFASEPDGSQLKMPEQEINAVADDSVLSSVAVEANNELAVEDEEVSLADTAYFAYAVEGGNIYYDPNTGKIKDCDAGIISAEIPSEINDIKIVSIDDYSFKDCSSLVKIKIPKTITYIGQQAFQNCGNLSEVEIEENNDENSKLGIQYRAFSGCSSLEVLILPKQTSYIGTYFIAGSKIKTISLPCTGGKFALAGCSTLEQVDFLKGIKAIPSLMMASGDYSNYVKKVTLPDTVVSINENAFNGCFNLDNLYLPDSVTSIGEYAFSNCKSLENIRLSSDLKEVGYLAFRNCAIKSIYIPKSLKSTYTLTDCGNYLGGIFAGCKYLKNVEFETGIEIIPTGIFSKTGIEHIEIPNSVKTISTYSFRDCNMLKSVEIPNSVVGIGLSAFEGCRSLENVTIPSSLEIIYGDAFKDCENLKNVEFGDGLKEIKGCAFENCKNITSVIIPNSVTIIGSKVFNGCSSLEKLKLSQNINSLGYNFIAGTKIKELVIPATLDTCLEVDGKGPLTDCTTLEKVTIEHGAKKIPQRLFRLCYANTIEIPPTVEIIESRAFSNCYFEKINVPNSVLNIEECAFQNCYKITSFNIPNINTINVSVFNGCKALKNIEIPETVKEIKAYAFAYCSNLSYIKIPNNVINIENDAFYNCEKMCIICEHNSYAETYAKENNIPYIIVGAGSIGNDGSKLELPTTKNYSVGTQTTVLNCLTATLTPHTNDKSDIVWTSSNTDVVDVIPSTGIDGTMSDSLWCNLNCKAVGTSVITVSNSKGASASCLVTLTEGEVDNKNNNYGLSNKKSSKTKEEQLINAIDEYETALCVYEKNVVESLEKKQISETTEDDLAKSLESKLISLTDSTVQISDKQRNACCKALLYTLRDISEKGQDLGKIKIKANDEISVAADTVKAVMNQVISWNESYSIDEYNVQVSLSGIKVSDKTDGKAALFGTINCKPKKGGRSASYAICSSVEDTQSVMADYLAQLTVMEKNALDEALISTIDFFNEQVGIDKYIKSKFTKIIDKYTPQLNNLGLGELVSLVEDCKTVCTHIKKIVNLDTNDLASCYDEISSLSKLELGSTSKVSTRVVNKAYKNLITCRNNMITAATNYISNTPKEETLWDKITSWKCPVDIIVYDAGGNEIGSVIGDEITCNSDDIMIKKTGDLKQVYTSNGAEVSFKIIAIDYGLLNVTVEDYVDNEIVGRQNFYNIPLDINEELTTSSISDKIDNMIIYTPSGEIINDEYINSSADAVVNISILSSENGSVQGAGEYAKGDAVNLKAVPSDGYVFSGWYNSDDELLSDGIIYNFTAYEDVSLKAAFAAVKENETLKGDLDGDNKVTVADALIAARLAIGKVKNDELYSLCDYDNDGRLTVNDALILARYALGKISQL